jgi:putative component of toxin-antitoxin plasmid stabilization module
MNRFEIREISEVSGLNKIYKLLINGKCEFDEFIEQIKAEGTYSKELDQIQAHLEDLGNNNPIPHNKFKELHRDKKDNLKDFEIRTNHLRVYLIREKQRDKLIILAGKKTTQKSDIKRLRKLKKEYQTN